MPQYLAIQTSQVASMMLRLEVWLAQSTKLHSGSTRSLGKVSISRRSHILVQVRHTCSQKDSAKLSTASGFQILHHCHRSIQSGLQGEFSVASTVPGAKHDEQTLLPSPRNSIEGHLALLESTHCNILISAVEPKVDHILSKRDMRHLNVEGLKAFLRGDFIEHYEYTKTFEDAAHDPFIVVHTSGSTGLPKPIILYHGGVATVDAQHRISSLNGYNAQVKVSEDPVRVCTGLPPFHVRFKSLSTFSCGARN